MKNKKKIIVIAVVLVVLLSLPCYLIYRKQTVFELAGIKNPDEITRIVTYGTGFTMQCKSLEITDEETVKQIVENFKNVKVSYDKKHPEVFGGSDYIKYTFYNGDKELGSFEYNNLAFLEEEHILVKSKKIIDIPNVDIDIDMEYKIVSGNVDEELVKKVSIQIRDENF